MNDRKYVMDDELLAGIRGNRLNESILQVYRQFEQPVTSFILSSGGSQQDSEDIFQETVVAFIDLVKSKKFLGNASIKTFLISIARNIWLNEIKKRKSLGQRGRAFEIARGQIQEDVTGDLYQREIKQQFIELLNKLGEPCKGILYSIYYEDLSFKEMVSSSHYENEQVLRNKKSKCLKELVSLVKQDKNISKYVNTL